MQTMSLNLDALLGAVIALVAAYLGFRGGLYVGENRVPTIEDRVLPPVFHIPHKIRPEPLLDPVSPGQGARKNG